MATASIPRTLDELSGEYMTGIARKLLRDDSVRVTSFEVRPEPFLYPKFGNKSFDELVLTYESHSGGGQTSVILRRLPRTDAVMTLTGDTQHRELLAFKTGLFDKVPDTFHIPYIEVIHDDEAQQYWAFVEDVREDMARLGAVEKIPDETLRDILSHLAAFHARFWEDHEVLDQPWLMSLDRPVNTWYPAIVDIIDGTRTAECTDYLVQQWPWLPAGVLALMDSLPPERRSLVEGLFRHPERLLALIEDHPRTLCHYDFDNRNLGFRSGPGGKQTTVIDWEIVGEGLSSADVGRLLTYQQPVNMPELIAFYLDELEKRLGHAIDRAQWMQGFELVLLAIWQIVGFLFAAFANSPTSPVPDEMREGLKQRVYADIDFVVATAEKWLS